MNRNQKIALGCGGAGCLGLIVVLIAAGVIYFYYRAPYRASRDYEFNVNASNSNSNGNTNDNGNSNENSESNDNSASSDSSSALGVSDDDKHKLFQAASMTGDAELVRRVTIKLGLMNEDYTPGANYQTFLSEHIEWGARNYEFIQSINTPQKARAYVNEHFPD